MKIKNFINNEWVDAQSGETLDNFDPSRGEVYSTLPSSDEADVKLAVESAKQAFKTWSKTTAQERADILNAIGDGIEKRLTEFAEAESRDQGKTVALATKVDIPRAVKNFRYFASLALNKQEDCSSTDNTFINYTVRQPIGVTGLIAPWNLPLYLVTWKIAPALAFGNTAVCKPSELTPMTAFMLTEVFKEAGLPPGVCNMIFGLGAKAGRAIVRHPDVPLISFTGGTQTAESIITDSAPYFKKLGLELGGKNPNIIFDDCNFEQALETTLLSSFNNQGEICLCGSRIFLQEGIYDKFLSEFTKRASQLKVGDPSDKNNFMGALVSEDHMNKVLSYMDIAKNEGGKILTGGKRKSFGDSSLNNGYFVEPTIIETNDYTCRTMQEEIFGPVVTVTKFKSEEEVVQWANGTKYGLSGSIWTQDISRAHRVAHEIDSGTLWINSWMARDLRVPFGGMKASGMGREGGENSIDFYTEAKNICVKYN